MTDFFDTYGPSFLGLQLLRLHNEIDKGGTAALADIETDLPSRVASLLVYLKHCGPASGTELVSALTISHQLVSQQIDALQKHSLIKKVSDPNDRRRIQITLTAAGRKSANDVEAVCKLGDEAYRALFKEIGVDLDAAIVRARQALEDRPLEVRIRDAATSNRKKTTRKRRAA